MNADQLICLLSVISKLDDKDFDTSELIYVARTFAYYLRLRKLLGTSEKILILSLPFRDAGKFLLREGKKKFPVQGFE